MSEEGFWTRFNEERLDRRTFIKAASLLGGAAVFGLPLLGCQPTARGPAFEFKIAAPGPMLQVAEVYSGDLRSIFANESIKNVHTEFAGGGDQVRAVLTGGYHVAISSPNAGMSALEGGESARLVAGGYNASGVAFIVKADSPIKKPEDLKGRKFKIAYSRPNSNSHIVAFLGLQKLGIDPNDKNQVEFVSIGSTADALTGVKGGLVDIAYSTEPTTSAAVLSKEARVLWRTHELITDWSDSGMLTSQAFTESNPKELKAWIAAMIKSLDWLRNNTSEAAKDLAKVMGIGTDVAEAALKGIPKEVWSANMPKKNMDFMAKAAVEFKQLKAVPDWKVLINQSFLPDNLRDPGY